MGLERQNNTALSRNERPLSAHVPQPFQLFHILGVELCVLGFTFPLTESAHKRQGLFGAVELLSGLVRRFGGPVLNLTRVGGQVIDLTTAVFGGGG